MTLTYFTLTGTWLPDTNIGSLSGSASIQMVTAAGDVLPVSSIDGIVVPSAVPAQIINGVLCNDAGTAGVELAANTAALGLTTSLYYTVTPTLYYNPGTGPAESVPVSPVTFEAPTSSVTLDLSTVADAAGVAAAQVVATTLGLELLTAASPSAVQSALQQGTTYSIFEYGAKVDGQSRQDATISSGTLNQVSCTGYNFQASDVGKTIIVGSAASSTANQAHVTTIASLSGNSAVLTTAAGNAVTGADVVWGTDDGAAWSAALTALTNTGVGQLVMPAGISICSEAISLTPPTGNVGTFCFSLRGTSVATSHIVCTNAGGFLTLNLSSNQAQIDVRDLTLLTAIAGATTALTVTDAGTANALNHGLIVEHVNCFGFDRSSGYWASAIQALKVMRPLLNDVIVVGLQPPSAGPPLDISDTSPLFLATVGINLNESYTPQLHYAQVWNYFRGIQAISTISNWPQGSYIDDCVIANSRQGFYWYGPGDPPEATIRGGYYDCRDWNICFNGWTNGMISHALSYLAASSTGWTPSSTLATAVNTGTTPTTLTLASTAGFAEAGAVLIGSEWFTYNNLTTGAPGSGMNGTTLNNVVRAEFGTADPGTNYAIGTTVYGAIADILLIDTNTIRIDNYDFEAARSANRVNVMMQGGNVDCSVASSRFDADCYAVAISNNNTGAEVLNNSFGGTIQVLNGAADTIYVPRSVVAVPPALGNIGVVTTSCTISVATGTYQTCTLTASDVCTFTMPTMVAGQQFKLDVRMPASGSGWGYTFSGVLWPGGTAPTATTTLSEVDKFAFFCDGFNWYGEVIGQGYAAPVPQPTYDFSAISGHQQSLASGTPFIWSSNGGAAGAYGLVLLDCGQSVMNLSATATVTWGSETMTSLGSGVYLNNNSVAGWMRLFYLNGIPGGAQDIEVTLTQSGQVFTGYGASFSYTDISSAGTLQVANGSSGNPAVAVTAANSTDVVFGAIKINNALTSVSFTTRQSETASANFYAGDTKGSTTITGSTGTTGWCAIGLDLR